MLSNWTVIRLLGAANEAGSGVLDPDTCTGFTGWLWQTHKARPTQFALGTVVCLLATGVILGLLSEVLLEKFGLGTKSIENDE